MTHFLLSHHYPEEYNHCISFKFKGYVYRLCARCLGYFSSFFIFLALYFSVDIILLNLNWITLYLLPSFAFIDWGLTKNKVYHGNNFLRYVTGFLLGITGARLVFLFFNNPFDKIIYASVTLYLMTVAIILYLSKISMKSIKENKK